MFLVNDVSLENGARSRLVMIRARFYSCKPFKMLQLFWFNKCWLEFHGICTSYLFYLWLFKQEQINAIQDSLQLEQSELLRERDRQARAAASVSNEEYTDVQVNPFSLL